MLALLVFPVLPLSAEVGNSRHRADNDAFVVSGLGYPPIKAENAAQARLMARRAAILDAYRNALAGAGSTNNDEPTFYIGLSGFVKGLTIEREEYLKDGGIRILARVSAGNIAASSRTSAGNRKERGGPSKVTLDEWYKIIESLVKIDQ